MAVVEKISGVKTHTTYKLESGQKVPGVTTVLGILNKPALIHWAWDLGQQNIDYRKYRDKMAEVGTLAHYMVQCDLALEQPNLEGYSKEVIDLAENCLISYYEWRRGKEVDPLIIEKPMVSEKYKYGGTVDFYGYIDGVLNIVDLKTGKAIYPEMIHQLAAYLNLLKENGYDVKKVRLLKIGRSEDEGFEERVINITSLRPHFQLFKNCLNVYNLQKQIKRGI